MYRIVTTVSGYVLYRGKINRCRPTLKFGILELSSSKFRQLGFWKTSQSQFPKSFPCIWLLKVSEDNKKVRRLPSKPLPENTVEARQEAKLRTVYCVSSTDWMFCHLLFSFFLPFDINEKWESNKPFGLVPVHVPCPYPLILSLVLVSCPCLIILGNFCHAVSKYMYPLIKMSKYCIFMCFMHRKHFRKRWL